MRNRVKVPETTGPAGVAGRGGGGVDEWADPGEVPGGDVLERDDVAVSRTACGRVSAF